MGCCSSLARSEDVRGARTSCHEQHAPMWVVKVKDVLRMTGRLRPHRMLKEDGMLILAESLDSKTLVIFVSHQWLGRNHPDEKGEQLLALQSVLIRIHHKELIVENDIVSQVQQQKRITLSLEHCDQLLDACIWYDYFSVPQHAAEGSEEQVSYIRSIPYYIDSCQIFVALAPSLKNEYGHTCDFPSWLHRGWCRTEMWCKQLSDASDIPAIVITSSEAAHFVRPQWLHYAVHKGDFAVESDCFHCCQIVRKSLERKLSKLRLKDMNQFRFFTARFEKMVGLQPKERSLEEFWSDFALLPGVLHQKGLSPVACATLAEDTAVLQHLVVSRASVESVFPGMTRLEIPPGFRPLHLATTFASHNLPLLKTLLDLRADPNSNAPLSHTPLGVCRSPAAVELLVGQRADVNAKCGIFGLFVRNLLRNRSSYYTFTYMCVYIHKKTPAPHALVIYLEHNTYHSCEQISALSGLHSPKLFLRKKFYYRKQAAL